MILAVVLISIGKGGKSPASDTPLEETNKEQSVYLMLAILWALITGLIFTVNGLVMRHYCKYILISPL